MTLCLFGTRTGSHKHVPSASGTSSCLCTKGHLSEEVIFLVFQRLNWNPKSVATLSCVCKWFDDLAKRVLWKEFCKTRAPKMMLDLQSSGSHSVDGNWRALGKLLIYCSGCTKGGLFNSIHVPGHFVYRTRFSRTSGKSFLLPQCRTDVLGRLSSIQQKCALTVKQNCGACCKQKWYQQVPAVDWVLMKMQLSIMCALMGMCLGYVPSCPCLILRKLQITVMHECRGEKDDKSPWIVL
ncbi:hypothetical protein MTR67_010751 [Solanum verrucosum]|uniref:F-box domain-containing protein n=1 Tax=Solanum verrucosum TaxID=315347 RepID=A0AAF0QBD0_SOLVR|nr:hypothetical protein MTR67_010751 [Solanum verrucosum]